MTDKALATTPGDINALAEAVEQVVVNGNLAALTPAQRVDYYNAVCRSLGLNPLTKPFDYITLNGKLTLYARKDATEQLRRMYGVSVSGVEATRIDDVYVVTAYVSTKDGRKDTATGAVSISGMKGDALANALMKAETKAKRRATLSVCGLGMLDETELATISSAATFIEQSDAQAPQRVAVEPQTTKQEDAKQIDTNDPYAKAVALYNALRAEGDKLGIKSEPAEAFKDLAAITIVGRELRAAINAKDKKTIKNGAH